MAKNWDIKVYLDQQQGQQMAWAGAARAAAQTAHVVNTVQGAITAAGAIATTAHGLQNTGPVPDLPSQVIWEARHPGNLSAAVNAYNQAHGISPDAACECFNGARQNGHYWTDQDYIHFMEVMGAAPQIVLPCSVM